MRIISYETRELRSEIEKIPETAMKSIFHAVLLISVDLCFYFTRFLYGHVDTEIDINKNFLKSPRNGAFHFELLFLFRSISVQIPETV